MPEDKTGGLFRNKNPQSAKSPSHTGWIAIEGKRYRLSAWVREREEGGTKERYFAIRASDERKN